TRKSWSTPTQNPTQNPTLTLTLDPCISRCVAIQSLGMRNQAFWASIGPDKVLPGLLGQVTRVKKKVVLVREIPYPDPDPGEIFFDFDRDPPYPPSFQTNVMIAHRDNVWLKCSSRRDKHCHIFFNFI